MPLKPVLIVLNRPTSALRHDFGHDRLSQPDASTSLASQVLDKLSQRERDILHHLMQGKINKEIAAALNITEGTVKNHMSSILGKLQVQDRTAAALKVRDLGLM